MNRHEAYRLLAKALEEYRELPFVELSGLIGTHRPERVAGGPGDEFILDVSVSWFEHAESIRVHATVDSPSSFRLERVEGEILVSEDVD